MPLAVKDRFFFGLGGSVYAVKEAAYSFFILIFYTQVLGLSGSLAGLVLFVGLIWDAISDPLVGTWSDRTTSRWGRRHPFMVAGAVPLGIGMIGLFVPPEPVVQSQMLLSGWLLFWSLWIRTFVTLFALPHLALVAEITNDYHQRSQLLGMRTGFLFITAVCLPALALVWLFGESEGVDGRFVADNYIDYGWLSAVVVWAAAAATIWGTRHTIGTQLDKQIRMPDSAGMLGLARDFIATLQNHNFRNLLFYDLAASASWGITMTLNIIAWTYYWEASANEVSLIMAIPALTAVPLAIYCINGLSLRFHKHQILSGAIALMVLDLLWLYPLRMFDLLPANGHPLVLALLFLQNFFFIFLFVLRVVSAFSIIADVTDEHDADTGVRQEGGFYAAFTFTTKLAAAAGPLYGGIALDLIGLNNNVDPAGLSQSTLDGLVWAMAIGIVPLMIVAWHFSRKVSMTEQRLREAQERIAARDTESTAIHPQP